MKTLLSAVVGATLAFAAVEAGAESTPGERQVALSIESTSLATALDKWAQQSGFQIFVQDWEATKDLTAPSLKGRFTAQAALEQLLEGTQLTYVWINDKAVAIRKKLAPTVPAALQHGGLEGQTSISVAKLSGDGAAASHASGQGGGGGDDVAARSSSGERSSAGNGWSGSTLDEVIVTGSRLHRAGEGPTPVVVFDRKRIEQLGVTNVADVLNYVPQQSFTNSEQSTFGGARSVRLRGLGLGTTLVLINGRRTVTSALVGSANYFDLNTIPLAAVERIEVLSDSASAVYGADAVGGVVNVILKGAVESPSLDVYYGTADSGTRERRVSGSSGYNGDRLRLSLVLDAFERDPLFGRDRERFADKDFRRFGGTDFRVPTSNPGNVTSATVANLPGLPSRIAAVPAGSTGVGLTPADFLATAGQTNLSSPSSFSSVVPEGERLSGAAFGEWDMTQNISVFSELMYSERDDVRFIAPLTVSNARVPATNAFNPFGVPVIVNFLLSDLGPGRDTTEAKSWRGVAGLRGTQGEWDWEVSLLGIDEKASGEVIGRRLDSARLTAALASSDPNQALNVFQDGPGGSPDFLRSLVEAPIVNKFASRAEQASAFVRRPLFSTAAGTIEFVAGAEWRSEDLHFESNPTIVMTADREGSSAYTEFRAPVLRGWEQGPQARLALTLAGRYDRYSDFGGTFNPQYGIEWYPIKQVLVRASYGTSFRAPSLFELYQVAQARPGGAIPDPRRNNVVSTFETTSGGNPDLDPEESTSWTAGFLVNPVHGLKFGASYWSIEQDQRVQRLTPNLILANEAIFPDRIVRVAPTPADTAAGIPGALVSIDQTSINFGRLETNGVDAELQLSVDTEIGQWSSSLNATWVHEYLAADFPNTPAVERVGIANSLGTVPKWRGSATFGWTGFGLGLSTTARYVDSYADVSVFNVATGRTVDDQTLVDVAASITLDELIADRETWLHGSTLRVGALNVFDKEPPFAEVIGFAGLDFSQSDVRQRFFYVSLSKTF